MSGSRGQETPPFRAAAPEDGPSVLPWRQILHIARQPPFWLDVAGTALLAWIGCTLVIGLEFAALGLVGGDLRGVVLGLLAILFSPIFSWWGVAVTAPLTILLGLAVRVPGPAVAVVYGACGWAVMATLTERSCLSPMAILPAAAYGLVVWARLVRDRPTKAWSGAGAAATPAPHLPS